MSDPYMTSVRNFAQPLKRLYLITDNDKRMSGFHSTRWLTLSEVFAYQRQGYIVTHMADQEQQRRQS